MVGIERVVYRRGFVGRLAEVERLPAITIDAADLPEDVLVLLAHDPLDLGGTYGDPSAGEPIQYDALRIEHDQGDVEIVVYNRAIRLFTADSKAVKRIHEVCCRLDDIAGVTPPGVAFRPSSLRRSSPCSASRFRCRRRARSE